ncbi:protein of unknown function [Neorhodopirellula lusitana]|uniref:Uncharacterized protein n=1 Tax=Neorhodopirellula lusitana TaxID=445327 RepID=A0ABY1PXE7_9BACT|nr:sialate O-acetylesterase [Neorhodopirellula lusitana]SMP51778.1 protein of unknown function [Neorhodopirellula lusitana]
MIRTLFLILLISTCLTPLTHAQQPGVAEPVPQSQLSLERGGDSEAAKKKVEFRLAGMFGNGMVLQQKTDAPVWGTAAPGSTVKVSGSWSKDTATTIADQSGDWRTDLVTPAAGGPFEVVVESEGQTITLKDVLIGEVWICSGQSNMQWKMRGFGVDFFGDAVAKADQPMIRYCDVPQVLALEPQSDVQTHWSVCTPQSVLSYSAVAYFFANRLHQELGIPIGLVSTNWGGSPAEAWVNSDVLAKEFPEFNEVVAAFPKLIGEFGAVHARGRNIPKGIKFGMPSVLYNEMIHPLIPFAIRGAIWYQGESNVKQPEQYRKLFPTLIRSWREEWGQGEFPFYYVQIAPFKYLREPYPVALLREAQLETLSVPNTGMAVTMDIGQEDNIHPKAKQPVGERLAMIALARDYGQKDLVFSGPVYTKHEVVSDRIRLRFEHVGGGLASRDGEALSHFTIAGEDRKFVPAKAVIDGDTIVVHSDQVPNPVAVRFAWGNADQPNLMNREGLPSSSFRTDDWPFASEAAEAKPNSDAVGVIKKKMSVPVVDGVNWGEMLAEMDLVWNSLPQTWKESPFLGNGEQGTMMRQINPRTLQWDVGCSAAHDHRPLDQDDPAEKNVGVLNRGRLFIGHLELRFPEELTGGKSRLSLWDAEAKGSVKSAGGKAEWAALVHAQEPVMRFECKATEELQKATFVYVPEMATNPRAQRGKNPRHPANPKPEVSRLSDGVQTAVHNLVAGGQTAVAWKQITVAGTQRLWLSVQHSFPGDEAVDLAVQAVRSAAQADQVEWTAAHRDWWHRYYPASMVSTGDPFWDSFYWVQQYKLGSATRDKGWILDNQGPWLQPTAWNAIWWNLNAQVSHSGFATANRRGNGSALSHRLDINRDNLALNVGEEYRDDSYGIGRTSSGWDLLGLIGVPGTGLPKADRNISRECGNLLWAMHNVDLEYRYWQDTDLRDRVLYPILLRAVNYHRHFLVREADGLLHLPTTYSPEYRAAEDCSYDLDSLRWGCGRLLELAAEMGLTEADEPLIAEWKMLQKDLVPTHVNETGRMIGRNVALTGGHRHWSHLLAIYPLRTLTPDEPADRELIRRSLDHWHSFNRALAGYSNTGGACISALLGEGDLAYYYINRLKSFLHVNTFYSEAGGLPVIETPLHGATAMQEMLLQSWGGRLRVFPAIPKAWPNVQFHQLRGEGAFLVSARREQDETKWVVVQSENGGTVEVDPRIERAQWNASPSATIQAAGDGIYHVVLPAGGSVQFWPENQPKPNMTVVPVVRQGPMHRFGKP